jgi:hypothetical protein
MLFELLVPKNLNLLLSSLLSLPHFKLVFFLEFPSLTPSLSNKTRAMDQKSWGILKNTTLFLLGTSFTRTITELNSSWDSGRRQMNRKR